MTHTKPQSNFESKWGAACPICKKRKFAVRTSSSAEGGRDSVCKCDTSPTVKEVEDRLEVDLDANPNLKMKTYLKRKGYPSLAKSIK